MSVHQLIKNASVEVQAVKDAKNHNCTKIIVDDKFEHTFPASSRVSKHLEVMPVEKLQDRLNGGSFFFIEDHLVDWRDGQYNGFVHSDETISQYMDILGYQYVDDIPYHHKRNTTQQIILRSVWDNHNITVPNYTVGGEFNSQLSFIWNPFVTSVNSSFDIVRLICTNGMVGLTSFLNTKIPLFNRQVEHLDIAAKQIQNKISNIVADRIQIMAEDRSSVGQCLLLEDHILERLSSTIETSEHSRLMNLLNAVSPKQQLSNVYKDNVFNDKNLAAQLPAHLTQFDIFNVATELRTHTSESNNSSNFALDKFANVLLFDDNKPTVSSKNNTNLATFSDPNKAFMGIMAA